MATGTGSHVAHFAANFPKVLPRKQNLLYIFRHNRLRWPGSPRIWTRSVLRASEPTGATKFFESRPISYLWIIMNLTYQTSIHQISQDSFSVKVSPISFHLSRLMQRILLLLYFRWSAWLTQIELKNGSILFCTSTPSTTSILCCITGRSKVWSVVVHQHDPHLSMVSHSGSLQHGREGAQVNKKTLW